MSLTRPFLLLLIQFLAASTVVALFFPLQGYLAALGVPASASGFILGADALAALVVQSVITHLVTARTARRWLRAGALTLAAALFLEGTLTDPGAFTAARLLQGAGFICVVAALLPLFVLCIPSGQSGRAFGWISLARLVPYAAVPPLFELAGIAPAQLGEVIRWASLVALLIALLPRWLPLLPGEGQAAPEGSLRELLSGLSEPGLPLLWGACVGLYAAYALVFYFLKDYVGTAGAGSAGGFFTLATLVMMATRLAGGWLFDRWDKRHISLLALVGAGAAVAALPWLAPRGGLPVLALLCGLGWGIAMPLLNALVFDLSRPEVRGVNQNVAMLMLQAGFFIGPWAGGGLLASGGYPLLFLGAASLLLIAGLCIARVGPRHD